MLGWIASLLKLAGWWMIGHKQRKGLAFYMLGTFLWCIVATDRVAWDLLFLEAVTLVVLARNWIKWGSDNARLDC
jgi:hypothetical protein